MINNLRFWFFVASACFTMGLCAVLYWLGSLPQVFSHSVFFILLLTFALTLARGRQEIVGSLLKHPMALLCCAAVIACISLTLGFDFRVLADETNLLSTSQGLFMQKQLLNTTEQFFYYDSYHVFTAEIAHRPGFFAFLTSLVHHLIGFRWFNGFIVNYLVGLATLFAGYVFFLQHGSRLAAIAFVGVMAAFPIFQLNITSSGFDALNMLMVGLFYIQLYRFLVKPNGNGFELLCLLGILAAQARYESVLLAVPLLVLLACKFKMLSSLSYSRFFPLLPLLALPIAWQKLVSSSFANPGDVVQTVFSISHLLDNSWAMVRYLSLGQNSGQPVLGVVFFLALVGIVFFIYKTFKARAWLAPSMQAFYLCFLAQALLSAAQFSYYYGDYHLPWINRLSQIQLLWVAPFSAYALVRIAGVLRAGNQYAAVVFGCIALFMVGNNAALLNPSGKSLTLFKEYKYARLFLQEHMSPHRTLVISERSGMYAALGYSAVRPGTALTMRDALHSNLAAGLYQNVVLILPRSNHLVQKHELEDFFAARELARFQTDAEQHVAVIQLERNQP